MWGEHVPLRSTYIKYVLSFVTCNSLVTRTVCVKQDRSRTRVEAGVSKDLEVFIHIHCITGCIVM